MWTYLSAPRLAQHFFIAAIFVFPFKAPEKIPIKILKLKKSRFQRRTCRPGFSRSDIFARSLAFYQLICNCFIVFCRFLTATRGTIASASVQSTAHICTYKRRFLVWSSPDTIHIVFAMLLPPLTSLNLSILIGTQFAPIVNQNLSFLISFVARSFVYETICLACLPLPGEQHMN